MPGVNTYDAVVVGAGSAGSAAALHLAGAGLRVAQLDAKPFEQAGARWVDDVPPWMFDRADIPRPRGPEKRCGALPMSLIGPLGRGRVRLERPMWGVDMRLLTARLQDTARDRGVVQRGCAEVFGVELEGQRPVAVLARVGPGGRRECFRARLLVDASGAARALLGRVPLMNRVCPPLVQADLCSAAQQVCRVADRDGARRYLEDHGSEVDEVTAQLGLQGGYSTQMVHVHRDLETVELLLGAIVHPGRPTGAELLERLKGALPWIGDHQFGGQALIPVRRPYDRLAAPGIALVGDAACQTFPAHGSGVGSGLMAANMLALCVSRFADPGGDRATWDYQQTYQRSQGGVNAAYEVFRQAIEGLDKQDMDAALERGLVTAATSCDSLDQRMPRLDPAEALKVVRAAAGAPSLAGRLAPLLPRMEAVHGLYTLYPRTPNEPWLRWWSRLAAGLGGWAPDPWC